MYMKRYIVYVPVILLVFMLGIIGESTVVHAGGQMTLYSNSQNDKIVGDKKIIQMGDGTLMVFRTSGGALGLVYEITPQGQVIDRSSSYDDKIHINNRKGIVPVGLSNFAALRGDYGDNKIYI